MAVLLGSDDAVWLLVELSTVSAEEFFSDAELLISLFAPLSALETIVSFFYDALDYVAVVFYSAGWVPSWLFDEACPELDELLSVSVTT